MTEFISDVKKIPHSDSLIFKVLSDLSNLELLKDKIPEDKVSNFTCDTDSCSFSVDPLGNVRFVIIDREPNKTIKFKAEDVPFDINVWIQLVSKGENETLMKLTIQADLNVFIKSMVSKPMEEALDKISEMIAELSYEDFAVE
ncbi:MAG: SRPBCC domain-containing protein [Dysgonamonadaceae bacterium]|nr:SRPBCC domain-containing protein [Dysgonamonadaceae bacterium]MDD4727545.1 SRPBCC domain-containing protein [Dysgonamonadaceae bacterium]